MRCAARSVVLVGVLVFSALLLAENLASAQCPPGTRWSNRIGGCVPVAPSPYYGPAYPWGVPPPPPGRRGCNISYQNCLYVCAGVPACINNCNVGYAVCTGGS